MERRAVTTPDGVAWILSWQGPGNDRSDTWVLLRDGVEVGESYVPPGVSSDPVHLLSWVEGHVGQREAALELVIGGILLDVDDAQDAYGVLARIHEVAGRAGVLVSLEAITTPAEPKLGEVLRRLRDYGLVHLGGRTTVSLTKRGAALVDPAGSD